MTDKIVFEKSSLTISQQIELLQARNLVVMNSDFATKYLRSIGYFRLSAYFRPFYTQDEPENHLFLENSTFEKIIELYNFDQKLRAHILIGIEHVEIVIRSMINDCMSTKHGSHWMLQSQMFKPDIDHNELIEKIRERVNPNSKNVAIKHYYEKYSNPSLPPSWHVLEVMSIGALSKLYKNIDNNQKSEIASSLNLTSNVLETWLEAITNLRNACAHHERAWNKIYPPFTKPKSKKGRIINLEINNATKMQGFIEIIGHINQIMNTELQWKELILEHVSTCPVDHYHAMGFKLPDN